MNMLRNISLVQLIVSLLLISSLTYFVLQVSGLSHTAPPTKPEPQRQQKQVTPFDNSVNNRQQASLPGFKIVDIQPVSSVSSTPSVYSQANSTSYKSTLATLDDQSLLNLSDIIENSVVPVFLDQYDTATTLMDKNAAIALLVSRLPEELVSQDFQEIKVLLRDSLPYDIADSLAQKSEEKYRLNAQEQAYLSNVIQNKATPASMEEQIAIAAHLQSLKTEQEGVDFNDEPSQAFSDWQKTQERLEKIQASSNASEEDIHQALKVEYGAQVADDYLELSNSEKQWQEKYTVFLKEKNIISNSGLSDADKTAQIESLIRQHYDEKEWAAARGYLDLMSK